MNQPILEIKNIKTHFPIHKGVFSRVVNHVKAVNGVDLSIYKGETIGIVGESGCGKSTLGKTLLKLTDPTDGQIIFEGKDITNLSKKQMRSIRRDIQIIFQDPYSSLSPRMTIGDIIEEPMVIHNMHDAKTRKEKVQELLETVGLSAYHYDRYPHEFSGGQRQRIGIARALAIKPKVIIADEAVSALDVSIQSQILNLLVDLQKEFHLTYIFISHDLSVVKHISDRIAVMYLGKIVEISEADNLFENPRHPYTKSLLSAIPVPDPLAQKERIILKGDLPSPSNSPSGCAFHTRCPMRFEGCDSHIPTLREIENGHSVSCHLMDKETN